MELLTRFERRFRCVVFIFLVRVGLSAFISYRSDVVVEVGCQKEVKACDVGGVERVVGLFFGMCGSRSGCGRGSAVRNTGFRILFFFRACLNFFIMKSQKEVIGTKNYKGRILINVIKENIKIFNLVILNLLNKFRSQCNKVRDFLNLYEFCRYCKR